MENAKEEIENLRKALQEASLDLTVLIEAAKSVGNDKLAESVSKFRAKIDAALAANVALGQTLREDER